MNTQITIRDIPHIFKRRKKFFFFPVTLVTAISCIGAILMPAKYESYTTILLQKDEILNPLVGFSMAVSLTQADRLTTFNEIIYSRSAIHSLLDSLGIAPTDEEKLEKLIAATRRKIMTTQRGSDSFRITVIDTDPVKAQQSAALLAKIYIQMSLKSQQQQNEEAVRFFEQKVEEYRSLFESRQQEFMNLRQGRLSTLPQAETSFNTQLDLVEVELHDADKLLNQQQRARTLLLSYIADIDNPATISAIGAIDVQGATLYIAELKALALKYSELVGKYTQKYPEVQLIRQQLLNLLRKSAEALGADIELTRSRKNRIEARRDQIVNNLNRSISLNEVSEDRKTNYLMSKTFYDEMKVKLEQARVSRDLGQKGESKYVILDPARVPTEPRRPRSLIVAGGFGLSIFVGIAAVFLGEILDPTIRRRQDVEIFHKPIIAYLP